MCSPFMCQSLAFKNISMDIGWKHRWCFRLLVLCLAWTVLLSGQEANAQCVAEPSSSKAGEGLVKRLPVSCTRAEREAQSVRAEAILDTLEKGQPVELVGVVIHGELSLDRLSIWKDGGGSTVEGQASPKAEELRHIRGIVRIRDSTVMGAMRHRSRQGMLQFDGPVDFQGTTFREGVDLSRSIFEGPVELAGAVFQQEAYFVQGQFMQTMNCKNTKFGPHTRFHHSIFHGPVDCTRALFDGMAELLEVTFESTALFEGVRFGSGTGFSGSRFTRQVSFDEAIFSRDAFFTFSKFDETASFSGAQFLGLADFSDAVFAKSDDLARARFDKPPLFTRTKRVAQEPPADGFNALLDRHGLTGVFLLLAVALMAYALKRK